MSRVATGGSGVGPRRTALEVLARVEDDDAYANLQLAATLGRSDLPERDRAFATDLVYGTLRHQRGLDHLVDRFLDTPPPPAARRVLRLGAYQLVHRDDVPDYAAVAETVAAAPKRFRGLANAVLRRVAAAPVGYPDDATRLSYPDWVLERLVMDLGPERALGALEAMNAPARPTVRPDGYVQDLASQWVAALVRPMPGEVVVDLCAAPGGKATAIAGSGATVVACDLQEHRVGVLAANAERLGARDVFPVVADAAAPALRPGTAAHVLLDAPCSGLGVLRRRPDARWRLDPDAPDRLAALQRRLAERAVELLAPGGVLVYSVCTLTAAESLGVDEHLAASFPDLEALDPPGDPWQPWGRGAILLPQAASTDGMCCLVLRRPPADAERPPGTIAR